MKAQPGMNDVKHDSSVSIRARLIICALFAVFIVQAMAAARRDSVTIDEFAHLPVGLYALSTGDLSLDPINPPHTRMLAALPLLLDPPAFDPPPGTTEWDMGYHLMERNGARYHQILVRARTVIVAAAVLLGCSWWSGHSSSTGPSPLWRQRSCSRSLRRCWRTAIS